MGDGINDVPALARALVGMAMGAAGTAAAIETADTALMFNCRINHRMKGKFAMMNDKFIRIMLVVFAALLFLNLFYHPISSVLAPEAVAESLAQDANFGARVGSSITCSSDGKYVYATDGSSVYRSMNFGQRGTWEEVAR